MLDIVKKLTREHRFSGSVTVEPIKDKSCLEAFITLETKEMTLRFNPDFNPADKKIKHFCGIKKIEHPLKACVCDAAGHECGHIHLKDGTSCPGSVEEHEEYFFAPIHEVLNKKGKGGAVSDLSNLVEDIIDNTLVRKHQSNKGLVIFYDNEARTNKGKWDKAFEVYMRVQVYCWGDIKDKQLLRRNFTNDENVIKATKNIIQRLGLQRGQSYDFLADKNNWKKISTVIAEELVDLITLSMRIPMCGFGKAMNGAMRDPTNRQKFAIKRYKNNETPPTYMKKEEPLDHVYSFLAKQIPLKVETLSRQESFPVVPVQHIHFIPEKHRLEDINWNKPVIVKDSPFGGFVNFKVPEQFYELPLAITLGRTGFPSIKFGLIDCSPSMMYGIPDINDAGNKDYIPWGNKSRYHYACKSWYGIVEFLARTGILPNVEVSAGVFSDNTRIGKGLDNAKKALLNPTGCSTNLDIDKVEQMFAGQKSIFFTISDGEIQNWETIKREFIRLAREHYYFHLQIGPHSIATRSLQNAGLPVYTVNTGEELERLAIDLTRETYNSYVRTITENLRGIQ